MTGQGADPANAVASSDDSVIDDSTFDSLTLDGSPLAVLLVGTFGGGGVHHYVEEQAERLEPYADVEPYDMGMPPVDAGRTRFLQGLVYGLLAALRFPFRDPPDIVHVHTSHRFSFYRASVYVFVAKYLWGVPVILHVHGSGFDEFVDTDALAVAELQRRVFRASDEVVVLSPYWRDVVARRTDPAKVRVLPNAVEPDRYPDPTPADDAHVVFVSNLVERKGVTELVAAVDALLDRCPGEARVTIAGDGPLVDEVERLAADRDAVTYLGYVSEKRKRDLLCSGSVYVLPTYAEGLPIAMLEGMAGGNAVVSTAVGSIPEVVDADNGILVDPGDVDALAAALTALATDPDRRARLALHNRATVEERYAWDRVVDELLAMYASHARRGDAASADAVPR